VEQLDQALANTIRVLAQTVQEICLRRNMDEACPTHLTSNQFLILNLLRMKRRFAVGEIARILQVTPPAICRAVDKLEELDLARRRVRPSDRRTHDVVLRPAGREIMDRFITVSERRQARSLACFDHVEKELLVTLLRRLIHTTLEDEKDTKAICLLCIDRDGDNCALPESDTRCLRRGDN